MKRILSVLILFAIVLNFTGCRKNPTTISETASSPPSASPTASATPAPTPMPTVKPTPAAKKVISASGVYNGRADSNFIEITLANGEIKEFMMSRDKISLKEGDKISFEYTVSNGQNIIQSIKKVKE